MAGLWRNWMRGCKYLVVRRDGTVPSWPYFVIGAMDPAAPAALRAYAEEARAQGFASDYCDSVIAEASRFAEYRYDREHSGDKKADPDKPPHRTDHTDIVDVMALAEGNAGLDVRVTIGSYVTGPRK